MSGPFRWALFDDSGRCTSIVSSVVDLNLPYPVGAAARPEELYLPAGGGPAPREAAELSASRSYLVADGRDRVALFGLPAAARVLVNGRAQPLSEGIAAAEPGHIVVEAAPPFLAAPLVIEADTLSAIAARFAAEVDRQAEAARAAHGLLLAGQQEAYVAKTAEARSLLAGGSAGECPFLTSEAAARGVDLLDLASAVIVKADAWAAIAAEIEARRGGAKRAIVDAADIETLISAAAVDWPAPDKGEGQ